MPSRTDGINPARLNTARGLQAVEDKILHCVHNDTMRVECL